MNACPGISVTERDDGFVVTLPTGETIRVAVGTEGPLGVEGFRVRITGSRPLLVLPGGAHNTIEVMTQRSLEAETEQVKQAVAERDAARVR